MQCLLTTLNASVLSLALRERDTLCLSAFLLVVCLGVWECVSTICACFCFFWLLISILFFPDSEDVCIFVYLSVCNFFPLSLVCICFLTFEAFVSLSQILHNLTLCVCVCVCLVLSLVSFCVCLHLCLRICEHLVLFGFKCSVCLCQNVPVQFLFSMCLCI